MKRIKISKLTRPIWVDNGQWPYSVLCDELIFPDFENIGPINPLVIRKQKIKTPAPERYPSGFV